MGDKKNVIPLWIKFLQFLYILWLVEMVCDCDGKVYGTVIWPDLTSLNGLVPSVVSRQPGHSIHH